jgi:2-polyprenyl-3-methyl-5-hydroxy-6-metoxy-1,4-benzoquinol methylase
VQHDEHSFEEMYRATDALWSGKPNTQLVAEAADLPPGTALDIGCGEGADAVWLAARGWHVTAVDFAATALQRAAAHATAAGEEVAARIEWVRADVTQWTPEPGSFDLVSAQYMHVLPDERRALFARLADAVRPEGQLLLVGHDFSDIAAGAHRAEEPERFFTAAEAAAALDPASWEVLVAEARPRPSHQHEGEHITVHDAVVRARRRN